MSPSTQKLLNFTTEIPASRTIGEIFALLSEGGASAIMQEMEGGQIASISFRMATANFGLVTYRLPANIAAAQAVINRLTKTPGKDGRKIISPRFYNDKAYASNVAWRIVKNWIEVQLAFHQLDQAKLEQIMLPFAVDDGGATVYERFLVRGSLALPAPRAETPAEPINVTPV